jgi:hypothetical protein
MPRSHEEIMDEMKAHKARLAQLCVELVKEEDQPLVHATVERLEAALDGMPEIVQHAALALVANTRGM